jgi:hypothetical protein
MKNPVDRRLAVLSLGNGFAFVVAKIKTFLAIKLYV